MDLASYYEKYGRQIQQPSERLFVDDFLYPLLGDKIDHILPQHPFLDRTGRLRRIDFAYIGPNSRLALEVDGESYHAEGVIPNDSFDDSLFRQNEILRSGYQLVRFSYAQLQSPTWRPIIQETLRDAIAIAAPELLDAYALRPTPLQSDALEALSFYRERRGWRKGLVVLPPGTGKTVLSAIDAKRVGGRILFLVHRLDILKQSIDAYKLVWPDIRVGILTGEARDSEHDCDVLFASKDTLRQTTELQRFPRDWFQYIVVDEVHHGQSPTYREVLEHFDPVFMLGMTATPDRTDRRDIFELFDYNKVHEVPLQDAIEQGYLVPFTYHGLTDDIDYSHIRYQNQRYRVDDLERFLIIPERNEAILNEYHARGQGDKAIGFCVSIKHAERMSKFFQENGVSAAAVHSQSPNRDAIIKAFRNNNIQVAFTVDLFNEGVDFPNVRVLLFLRPTESKTVFIQQLGRGLRLCTGKDRVRILDFIGNYKRANQIRKYLSKSSNVTDVNENGDRRRRRIEYQYSTGCEVHFDAAVEEFLNRQDAEDLGVTKEDLKEAYFALAETLGHKPSHSELDSTGEFKSSVYVRLFGSWLSFLREIGEYTEASYHYPQGTHIGHVLSIIHVFGGRARAGTHFDDQYVRLRGELGEGRISTYRRQVKYKLQAAMELGVLVDDRNYPADDRYPLTLTPLGDELHKAIRPLLASLKLGFPLGADRIPTTRMSQTEEEYNRAIRTYISTRPDVQDVVFRVFLNMHGVQQMLAFLYHVCRATRVERTTIYEQFFQAPFVKHYCDQEGIEEATLEASRRRCPFLLNILDSCGIINADRSHVSVLKLALSPSLVRPYVREESERSAERLKSVAQAWPRKESVLESPDLSILRELFGPAFLTSQYHLKDLVLIPER